MSDEKVKEIFDERIRGLYFRRDGTPYRTILEWSADFEKGMELRRVDETILWWGGRISTVWLGLDHSFGFHGPPLIFETMVFSPDSLRELEMVRYSTEAEAFAGHKALVKKWTFTLRIIGVWMWVILDNIEKFIKR